MASRDISALRDLAYRVGIIVGRRARMGSDPDAISSAAENEIMASGLRAPARTRDEFVAELEKIVDAYEFRTAGECVDKSTWRIEVAVKNGQADAVLWVGGCAVSGHGDSTGSLPMFSLLEPLVRKVCLWADEARSVDRKPLPTDRYDRMIS